LSEAPSFGLVPVPTLTACGEMDSQQGPGSPPFLLRHHLEVGGAAATLIACFGGCGIDRVRADAVAPRENAEPECYLPSPIRRATIGTSAAIGTADHRLHIGAPKRVGTGRCDTSPAGKGSA